MKKLLIAVALAVLPISALAGTITITIVEGGFSNVTKTFTLPDAQIDRLVAAYQSPANVSVNGSATRVQVLNYIVTNVWMKEAVDFVQKFETPMPTIPTPINPQ